MRADGAFELRGLIPGNYRVTGAVPNADGWRLSSVVLGGRDLLDAPLEITGSNTSLSSAVATFTDRHTQLGGTLQTAAGRPASEYFVVVFPADRRLWSSPRRVRSTRPATSGRFDFTDLPPGSYRLAAVTDVDATRLQTPEFLEQCEAVGVQVRIDDGGRHTQDVRIAR